MPDDCNKHETRFYLNKRFNVPDDCNKHENNGRTF